MRLESASSNVERQALLRTIEALEGQRGTLGDSAVDLALAPLRARLAADGAPVGPATAAARAAERKIVTVVFADVAGFTGLSERIGAEATLDIVNGLFDRVVPIVERYGGAVDKFIGDEIMAVFGAPKAVERHAEHALRATLAMFAAVDDYGRQLGLSLALHAGVNTGEVVAGAVGSIGRHDYSVTGDTVNVAARLEAAAARGEIIVGPSTYRHTLRQFEFEALEPLALKGKSRPLPAYRVIGTTRRADRAGSEAWQLPFCGRAPEFARLLSLACTEAGVARGAVFVRGEPGLGKTRLVSELEQQLSGRVQWLAASGQDFRTDVSYGVVSDLIDRLVGLADSATRDDAMHAYADYVNGFASERVRQALPYLLWLRGLQGADAQDDTLSALTADALRGRIAAAVADLLAAATGSQPTVVCVEDVHWADPSSVTLLQSLAHEPALAHVLFLLTTRPEHSPASAWLDATGAADAHRIIDLQALSEEDSRALLDQAFAVGSTPALIEEVRAKSQGNPLFLASFLRSLVDSGLATLADGRVAVDAPVSAVAIPDTLQAVVGSQIDRLPALGKEVLHWAAVFGNTFASRDVDRIARAQGREAGVEAMLALLCERQLLVAEDDDRLRFVHALVRDVSYYQMLDRERRRLHGLAADIVEQRLAALAEPTEADVAPLAWHLERAGDRTNASRRYEQAAALACASHAHLEEINYLEAAIRLADPADRQRIADLRERSGDALQGLGRYPEAADCFEGVVSGTRIGLAAARLHRKIARAWTPRFSSENVNRHIEEARRCLASIDATRGDEWWREHFATELFAMYALYMQARTAEMAALVAAVEPEIGEYATIKERGLFHRNLGLLKLRQCRYRADGEIVRVALRAREEVLASGDTSERCLVLFGPAFALLWSGAYEAAAETMEQVLQETVRLGDAERNLLCLVYLAVAARYMGNVDSAEAYAKAAVARARANRAVHYEAVSLGTLAWVAWRRGDSKLADELIEFAQASTIPQYPFAWLHASVALARAVERDDPPAACKAIALMLEPWHQRLDDDVQQSFEAALAQPDAARLQRAVEGCHRMRYL